MTPEETNIKIAEELGWRRVSDGWELAPRTGKCTTRKFVRSPESLPKFNESLDACAQFEATLTNDESDSYRDFLEGMCMEAWIAGESRSQFSTFATAPQRCAAFLSVKLSS